MLKTSDTVCLLYQFICGAMRTVYIMPGQRGVDGCPDTLWIAGVADQRRHQSGSNVADVGSRLMPSLSRKILFVVTLIYICQVSGDVTQITALCLRLKRPVSPNNSSLHSVLNMNT